MIFQKESIEAILAGRKTMTRRLVKEGEGFSGDEKRILKVFKINSNKNKSILKWQVGRKYAVCVEGKQVWYCPKCLSYSNEKRKEICEFGFRHFRFPLFVEVTGIRKEKLLDITEEDAKREGFRHTCEIICDDDKINLYTRQNFIDAFCKIYGIGFREDGVPNQNPYTWVISFKVV